MRVLVTGGLGFVGHAVTRQLVGVGHEVVVLSSRPGARSRVDGVGMAYADIRDRSALSREVARVEPEAVCHLAALTRVRDSFEAPVTYFDVNVGGTVALLGALENLGPVPVVMVSTGAVYGACEGHVDEAQPTRPTNPYAASKLAAEELLSYQAGTGAVGAVTMRCFNVAGAVDGVGDPDRSRIIPKALAVAAGLADELVINGDGKAVREFTHVADVAAGVAAALGAARSGYASTYNAGSGTEATMLDVVEVVEAVTGRPVPVRHVQAKPEPAVVVANSSAIREQLGWIPEHTDLRQIVADAWAATTRP